MLFDVPIQCSAVVDVESWRWCKVELVLVERAYLIGTLYMRSW